MTPRQRNKLGLKLVVYYVTMVVLVALLLNLFPEIMPFLPFGGLDELQRGNKLAIEPDFVSLITQVRIPLDMMADGVKITLSMLGALLLMIPVRWVYIAVGDLEVAEDMLITPPRGLAKGFSGLMNAYNSQRVGAGTVALGIAAVAYSANSIRIMSDVSGSHQKLEGADAAQVVTQVVLVIAHGVSAVYGVIEQRRCRAARRQFEADLATPTPAPVPSPSTSD